MTERFIRRSALHMGASASPAAMVAASFDALKETSQMVLGVWMGWGDLHPTWRYAAPVSLS